MFNNKHVSGADMAWNRGTYQGKSGTLDLKKALGIEDEGPDTVNKPQIGLSLMDVLGSMYEENEDDDEQKR